MGKGEIARHEQFLLLPQCFKKLIQWTRKNQGLFWKGLNPNTSNKPVTFEDILEIQCRYRICHELTVEIEFY